MRTGEGSRKRSKLGSVLILLLVAAVLFVVLLGVVRLAGWVVRATFPEEELNDEVQSQLVAGHSIDSPALIRNPDAVRLLHD
jgi:hypothetical protein